MMSSIILNYQKVCEKSILINDSGYFFDYLFYNTQYRGCDDVKKYIATLKDLNNVDLKVLMYPSSDEILKNFNVFINSKTIVVLNKSQEQEINTLSTYFRKITFNFDRSKFIDFIGLNLDTNDLKEDAKTNTLARLILIFFELKDELNLNPSNFYNNCKHREDLDQIFSKNDFKDINENKFPLSKKFIKIFLTFNIDLFSKLLYFEITGQKDDECELLMKIIGAKDLYNIPIKDYTSKEREIITNLIIKGMLIEFKPNFVGVI